MRVTLNRIKAGPDGTADAGQTIEVDEKLGKFLTSRKIASLPSGTQTAAIDIDQIRNEEHERAKEALERAQAEKAAQEKADRDKANEAGRQPQAIIDAAAKLDPANDEHWIGSGLPAVSAMQQLTGSQTLSRADISAAGDFRRPPKDTKPAAKAETKSETGARSNAP